MNDDEYGKCYYHYYDDDDDDDDNEHDGRIWIVKTCEENTRHPELNHRIIMLQRLL